MVTPNGKLTAALEQKKVVAHTGGFRELPVVMVASRLIIRTEHLARGCGSE
jgi:hypothetical protein